MAQSPKLAAGGAKNGDMRIDPKLVRECAQLLTDWDQRTKGRLNLINWKRLWMSKNELL